MGVYPLVNVFSLLWKPWSMEIVDLPLQNGDVQ